MWVFPASPNPSRQHQREHPLPAHAPPTRLAPSLQRKPLPAPPPPPLPPASPHPAHQQQHEHPLSAPASPLPPLPPAPPPPPQRTSISVNIKERLDFSCALFGPDGALVANAPHLPVHLGAMSEAVRFQVGGSRGGAGRGESHG